MALLVKNPPAKACQCLYRESTEKAREFSVDYTKAFDCADHNKLKEMGIPDHLTCLLRNLYAVKLQLELDMEQWTDSKPGKESIKAVYCHLLI